MLSPLPSALPFARVLRPERASSPARIARSMRPVPSPLPSRVTRSMLPIPASLPSRARRTLLPLLAGALLCAPVAMAAEFRATSEAPAVLYDAPSAKARPLYVYGRDVPVEVLVSVEGWTKVRDAGGTIGWFAGKALADKRVLLVRAPFADVRASPDEAAPVVFRAEQNVLLDLAETATSPTTTASPGWVKVRHRDGQAGFVRISQVFGL